MNKIGIKLKTRSPAIFWNKAMADSKKCNIRPKKSLQILKYSVKSLRKGCLPEFYGDSLRYLWDPEVLNWKVLLWFFSSFPQKASLAWIPHWRCWRTKCKESELNTPKVSENLVRFTSPLFTGKAPQSPENIFGMSSMVFKMNMCCEEKWDEMRK